MRFERPGANQRDDAFCGAVERLCGWSWLTILCVCLFVCVTLQIDGAASLGSEIFPLGNESRSTPFDGFHRATTPEVLK